MGPGSVHAFRNYDGKMCYKNMNCSNTHFTTLVISNLTNKDHPNISLECNHHSRKQRRVAHLCVDTLYGICSRPYVIQDHEEPNVRKIDSKRSGRN